MDDGTKCAGSAVFGGVVAVLRQVVVAAVLVVAGGCQGFPVVSDIDSRLRKRYETQQTYVIALSFNDMRPGRSCPSDVRSSSARRHSSALQHCHDSAQSSGGASDAPDNSSLSYFFCPVSP